MSLEQEYKIWLGKKGITRVPTQDDVNAFLEERNLPEKVKQDRQRWLSKHPRFQDTEKNWKLMNYWLDISNLPALYDNLDEAFAALLPTATLHFIRHQFHRLIQTSRRCVQAGGLTDDLRRSIRLLMVRELQRIIQQVRSIHPKRQVKRSRCRRA